MRFRILIYTLVILTGACVYRAAIHTPPPHYAEAHADEPRSETSVAKSAEQPSSSQPSLVAELLIIEPDWSKSPTADEVKADLEWALAKVPLPKHFRLDLLKFGPKILFSEENVEYYQPQTCAELMVWLNRHKLIRKQLPFPQLVLSRSSSDGKGKAFVSLLSESNELLPGPHPKEENQRPFVEVKPRWEWQVHSSPSSDLIRVDSVRADVSVELGSPDSSQVKDQHVVLRRASRRAGESAFFCGDSNLGTMPTYAPAAEPEEAGNSPKNPGWPVIWFRAAELPKSDDVTPVLRIPDRVEKPSVVLSNAFDRWEPIAGDNPSPPTASAIDGTDRSGETNPAEKGAEPEVVWGYSKPGDPVLRVVPSLLLIESDWSKSPTAAEVKSDLEAAFADVALPDELRGDILKSGARILFSDSKVNCYQPRACAEFIAWLETHKLVRATVKFPQATLKMWQFTAPGRDNLPGYESDLRDEKFLPVPNQGDSKPAPFVEVREQRYWQVFSKTSPTVHEIYSGIERTQFELGKANHESSTYRRLTGKMFEGREGESMFVAANLGTDLEQAAPDSNSEPNAQSAKQPEPIPVIWLQAIETLSVKDAAPKLRIPDRLQAYGTVVSDHVPQRTHWTPPVPGEAVGSWTYDASTDKVSAPSVPGSAKVGPMMSEARPASATSASPTEFNQSSSESLTRPPKRESARVKSLRYEFQQLDARASNLAGEIASQDDPVPESDIARHRESVRAAVKEAFLAGQKLHEAELAEFQQRMKRLQELIAERTRNSDKIIDRRVADLLDRVDPSLKWSPATTPADQPSAPSTDPSVALPPNDLEGVWRIGASGPKPAVDNMCVVFWKDRTAVFEGKQRIRFHSLKLGLDRMPHTIDLDAIEGGESSHGIFEIVGDRMRMNIIQKPGPRPESFANDLFEFERVSRDIPREFLVAMRSWNQPTTDSKKKPVAEAAPTPKNAPRRPVPLSTTIGVVSDVRDDGTIVVSSKERGEFQVGEELILSYVSKEGGGTYKPAGWIKITELEDDGTAIGRSFELPREQIGNRFIERQPREGDFVERPMDEKKIAPATDGPASAEGPEERESADPAIALPAGKDRSAISPKKAKRRPFIASRTVGVISEVRNDGTVIVSCKEPDDLDEGEELILYSRDMVVRNASMSAGWIVIKKVQNAVTAIGQPSELTREIKDNLFVDRLPKPGDIVERPVYQEDPGKGAF